MIERLPSNGRSAVGAAARAARQVHARAASSTGRSTRLRRRGFEVLALPFVWTPSLGLDGLEHLATRLDQGLQRAGEPAAAG